MKEQDLIETLRTLKLQINDPINATKHVERKDILNKIQQIKHDLRSIALVKNVESYNVRHVDDNKVNIETVFVEEDFTKKHIDTYRYHSLLKRLNEKYINDNCRFKKGDLVKSGDKIGFIDGFEVYPDKVKRKITGIYAQLVQRRQDGTISQKALRRSRLDDAGFPIEELEIVPN